MTREQEIAAFSLRVNNALRMLVCDQEEQGRILGALANALTDITDQRHLDRAALLHRLYLEWFGSPAEGAAS